tara:strand:- start:2837 stop:4459 length:1623 start_codon:yes stop_codon:yes gene_type:complete
MAKKFSDFTNEATAGTTQVVGYKTGTTVNTRYSLAQLATGISAHLPASSVLVNKTLYVDTANGDDAEAVVGDMSKPYKTITAAKTAASVGDIVHVRPGTYEEDDITKDGVAMYFDFGAIVHPTDAIQTASGKSIIDVSAYANKLIILGYGEFISDYSGTLLPSCVNVATDEAYIEFYRCTFTNGSATGSVKATVWLSQTGTNEQLIECKGDVYKTNTTGGSGEDCLGILNGNIQFVGNVYNLNSGFGGAGINVDSDSADFKGIGNIYVSADAATSYGLYTNNRGSLTWLGNIEVGTQANGYAFYTSSNYTGTSSIQGAIKGAIYLGYSSIAQGSFISGTQTVTASPSGYAITQGSTSESVINLNIVSNYPIFDISAGLVLFQGVAQIASDSQKFINCTGGKFVFNGVVADYNKRLTNSTITGGEVVIQSDFESWGGGHPTNEYVFYVDGGTLRVDGCKIENHQTTAGSGVIEYVSGNLILNAATLVSESVDVTTFSVKVVGALNYLGYNDSFANMAVGGGGSLTNLITGGGAIVVDTDVE